MLACHLTSCQGETYDGSMPVYQIPHLHQGALAELAEVIGYGFEALKLRFEPVVVLGAHTLQGKPFLVPGWSIDKLDLKITSCIIYNTEHPSSPFMTPQYRRLLEAHQVWSYYPDGPGKYVPIGYMPQMTRIPKPAVQDIDVLFYGSMNYRRANILRKLEARGLNVRTLPLGTYGAERDGWIARSKVVLSVHYYTPAVMESVRLSYLWANRKCVVTESTENTAGFHYDDLVDACIEFVKNEGMRITAEDRCFRIAQLHREDDILKEALR